MSVHHAPVRLGVATQPARKVPGFIQWFAGSRQSTRRHPLLQAHQKSGSFPPPALPDINGRMTLSDPRQHRRPAATSRPLPSCQADIPQLPDPPFPHAVPNTPMDQSGCTCRLLPHSTRAFSVSQAGRRPSLHFRGLLRLHTRYGLFDCSAAQGGLLSRGFGPAGYPAKPLVSYQVLPTTSWVDPSSTGEPRRWGALRNPG